MGTWRPPGTLTVQIGDAWLPICDEWWNDRRLACRGDCGSSRL